MVQSISSPINQCRWPQTGRTVALASSTREGDERRAISIRVERGTMREKPVRSWNVDWKLCSSPYPLSNCKCIKRMVIVQLSNPYMSTGETIAFTIQTFVGKVMSLLFIILSKLVIAFLPRSKRLLISWLQSPSAVILEPKKIVCHCFHIYVPLIH